MHELHYTIDFPKTNSIPSHTSFLPNYTPWRELPLSTCRETHDPTTESGTPRASLYIIEFPELYLNRSSMNKGRQRGWLHFPLLLAGDKRDRRLDSKPIRRIEERRTNWTFPEYPCLPPLSPVKSFSIKGSAEGSLRCNLVDKLSLLSSSI